MRGRPWPWAIGPSAVWTAALCAATVLAACDAAPPVTPGADAGGGRDAAAPPDAGGLCADDRDCDDGLFCNGSEACDPESATSDENGCVPAPRGPCTAGGCDEEANTCGGACPDADGDGHPLAACGGDDCDDADAERYPGNAEICDADDHDEDCESATFGFVDVDADGAPDADCCNAGASGTPVCGTDCDDAMASVNPTNPEICDGIDNNCDGAIDDVEAPAPWYLDGDGDGHGDAADSVESCTPVEGRVLVADDCDDADDTRFPLATEECDGDDDDCDSTVDEEIVTGIGAECTVAGAMGACARGAIACRGASGLVCEATVTPTAETCNGVNDDCDGATDEGVPGVGAACTVAGAYGACAAGTVQCMGAAGTACVGPSPRSELCSAANENCDASGDGYDGLTCRPGQTAACNVCPGTSTPGSQACDAGCGWGTCVSTGYGGTWSAESPIFVNQPASTATLAMSSGVWSWRWSSGASRSANLHLGAAIGVLPPGLYRLSANVSVPDTEPFRITVQTSAGVLATSEQYTGPYGVDFRVDGCRDVTAYFNNYFYYGSSLFGRLYSITVTRIGD